MRQTWQATVIAVLFIGLAGAIFLTVYIRSGIGDALKAWAAIGTIGGVITGVIPAYFFGQQRAEAAERVLQTTSCQLKSEQDRRTEAEERAHEAEERARLALAHSNPTVVETLRTYYPSLFPRP
jgi:hypothetical protein